MFKVGDKVKIKSYEYCMLNFCNFNVTQMKKYCGKIGIINRIEPCDYGYFGYKIYLDITKSNANHCKGFYFADKCVEHIHPTILDIE